MEDACTVVSSGSIKGDDWSVSKFNGDLIERHKLKVKLIRYEPSRPRCDYNVDIFVGMALFAFALLG